ncbi:MAG: PucR family transcriptional regulator [Corynebacterium sp.]|uniref:PucR family transcriptional regulator n=1 Tax=Corynebacterium sp. TaxID=1720 RepID=UPI0026DC7E59|nr:PucR family transcriptional regulator [Corynebacterium sp.]MDO5099486.1 PucR family transcriptional regulator [Corynebacterium sp.]
MPQSSFPPPTNHDSARHDGPAGQPDNRRPAQTVANDWEYGAFLTIRDVLETPTLSGVRVEALCAPRDLDRPVRWVHVADAVRTGELLSGGELLLTTGIAWGDTAAQRTDMIATFAHHNAAALLVELGSQWQEVPADVAAACRTFDLPLIVLFDEVKFTELTENVHTLLLNNKITQVTEIHAVTKSFNSLIINGAPTMQILDHASRLLGCPVVLEDLSHQVVGYSEGHMTPSILLADWSNQSRKWSSTIGTYGSLTQCVTVGAGGETGAKAVVKALTEKGVAHGYGANLWTMIDIQARGTVWGRLFYFGRSTSAAGGDHILSQAATALAMERLGSTNPYSWVDLIEKTAIERLVHNRYTSVDGVKEVLSASGFRMHNREMMALRIEHSGRYVEPTTFRKHIKKAFPESDFLATAIETDPRVVIAALSVPIAENSPSLAATISGKLRTIAEAIVSGTDTKIRITTAAAGAGTLELSTLIRQLFQQEQQPMPRAAITVVPLSRTPVEYLLLHLRDDVRIQEYVATTLEPLLNHDHKNSGDLLDTLHAVISNPTSRTAAAEQLHLSRTALYARIATIERLLGIDLADGDAVFAISLALRSLPQGG